MHHLIAMLLVPLSLAAEPVNGRLEQIGELRVLHVWGTPQEMGYAHGWLVGSDFATAMHEFFDQVPASAAPVVDLMRSWADLIDLDEDHRAELAGLYQGMRDRVGDERLQLAGLDRMLDETDLRIWNGYDMFRAVGCSGFAVWDARTGGAPIVARTLDLAVFSPHWVASQIVLVRHPNEGHATASVIPVGLLGIMTGINEHGVCGFLHDGDGPRQSAVLEPERPVMFAIQDILSRAAAGTAQTVAAEELAAQGPFPFSYMIRIAGPRRRSGPPAVTWRLDADGTAAATAGDGLTITTNHTTTRGDEPPRLSADDSCRRYGRLYGCCNAPKTPIDAAAAWDAIVTVGQDHASFMTLHAVVAEPESGRWHVGVAHRDATGALRPATDRPPTLLSLDALFADPRPGHPVPAVDDGVPAVSTGGHEVDPGGHPLAGAAKLNADLNPLIPARVPLQPIE
ncbi:MAG: C45 family autoproteolytic acyltransferase/hydrolase [Phycisphaerales bacterium]|nr:C45 family autoproteolytic acyltransferase/hydrolase [Phycisphaerales bacterium]